MVAWGHWVYSHQKALFCEYKVACSVTVRLNKREIIDMEKNSVLKTNQGKTTLVNSLKRMTKTKAVSQVVLNLDKAQLLDH